MSTQFYTATSIDGFIADEHNSLEWLTSLGDANDSDNDHGYSAFYANVGALAMGSTTYEWLLKNLVYANPLAPAPWPYEKPTWVLSHRELPVLPGANIRFAQGDIATVHTEMMTAAGGQNVWVVGGGDLAGQFYDRQLLDEVILSVAPVTLGSGAPLFPRRAVAPALTLRGQPGFDGTFVQLHYDVTYPGAKSSSAQSARI
ncbi:dihydrofolate reductase family protein [Klugiella xanthotipulae]|uniref:Dihydrofolate reductase n=1 Tax=Klugiella xanthotipulae TaxID=244735 RepID=A0A543HYC3_9MICO|nr:dihydrofolate reductase family protein [Klugiella xanthotipulae]TQM63309.1 dihydrofolate reductase [Klugiella xanthotipulae]